MKKEEKKQLIDELINEVTFNFECVQHMETYVDEEDENFYEIEFDVNECFVRIEFFKSRLTYLIAKDCDEYFKEKYKTEAIAAEADELGESKFYITIDFSNL
jgi:hypothetical protein|nr:MAG TPA: hypothetical protein [Caudoviricetes sp.]